MYGRISKFYRYQRKKGARFYSFSDGFGFPCSSITPYSIRERIDGYPWYWKNTKGAYLYSTQNTTKIYPVPELTLIKPIEMPKEKLEHMKKVFGYESVNDEINKYHVIYLAYGDGRERLCNAYNDVPRIMNEDKLLDAIKYMRNDTSFFAVQPHPINGGDFSGFNKIVPNYPFELSSTFLEMESKIFITSLSSALLSMKWLFDKEPYIIFAHRIIGFDDCVNFIEEYEHNIQTLVIEPYMKPDKIYIPNTQEELLSILESLLMC
jgi:hypothetical protein